MDANFLSLPLVDNGVLPVLVPQSDYTGVVYPSFGDDVPNPPPKR